MLGLVRLLIVAAVILLVVIAGAIFFGGLFSFPFMWVGMRPGISMLLGVMIFQVLLVLDLYRHTESRWIWTGVFPILGLLSYAWQRARLMAWTQV